MKGYQTEATQFLNVLPLMCKCDNGKYAEWFMKGGMVDSEDFKYDEQSQAWTSRTDAMLINMYQETTMHFDLPDKMKNKTADHPEEMESPEFGQKLRDTVKAEQMENPKDAELVGGNDQRLVVSRLSNEPGNYEKADLQSVVPSVATKTSQTTNRTAKSLEIAKLKAYIKMLKGGSSTEFKRLPDEEGKGPMTALGGQEGMTEPDAENILMLTTDIRGG